MKVKFLFVVVVIDDVWIWIIWCIVDCDCFVVEVEIFVVWIEISVVGDFDYVIWFGCVDGSLDCGVFVGYVECVCCDEGVKF